MSRLVWVQPEESGPVDSLFEDAEMSPAGAGIGTARRVPVLLPVALDQTYDYLLPADEAVARTIGPGAFVMVPFGPQQRIGVVWDKPAGTQPTKVLPDKKLKAIFEPLDVPRLPLVSLRFAEWIANYTLTPLGMVVRMMMSAKAAFEPVRPRFGVAIAQDAVLPPRMTEAREKVMQIAGDGQVRAKSELAKEAGCTAGVINGLVSAGCLVDVQIPERQTPVPNPLHSVVEFGEHQVPAVEGLRAAIAGENFSVTLLDGVTGSGKTEVYYEAVASALTKGGQVVILLPEIALTTQFMNRFKARFGCLPAQWHSALSGPERARVWKGAASGAARVVVGARSALFLPYANLGLIVVDEEHDQGYKQEDRVNYQARDMAVVRGSLGAASVVLASATPSIESHVNAKSGRYRHLVLKGRFSGVELPDVTAIDLRKTPPEKGRWLAPPLVEAVTEALAAEQQSLLFLNRRGYAPMTLCRGCGHRFECPQCTAWLVEHRFRNRLNCHHCGFSLPLPDRCPKCDKEDALIACGPGVERIAEEVAERFPDARVALLSSDLVPGLMEMREVINKIERGEADIIIGTQMVAKGHHFPGLSLVGIIDADLGLGGTDPRAAERTFQLLHQVTGRAGRTFAQGRGLVQTHLPDHPVMQAIIDSDRDSFVEREIKQRQLAELPPYGRLAALIISARMRDVAEGFARETARKAPFAKRITVLGPAEAPIAVVRGRHRFRLLVKAPKDMDMQGYIRQWLAGLPPIKGDLKLAVDIDPYNFL